MRFTFLFLVLVGCAAPSEPEPRRADFVLILSTARTAADATKRQYRCFGWAWLTDPVTGARLADTIDAIPELERRLALRLPIGSYRADFGFHVAETPAMSWRLEGSWSESRIVQLPDSEHLRCP